VIARFAVWRWKQWASRLPMVGLPIRTWLGERTTILLELVLATPVVLWAAIPFFKRGWSSILNRSPNMWTLIMLGVGAAFGYSIVAALAPSVFPESFRDAEGNVPVYFEAAAVIVTLIFLAASMPMARSVTSRSRIFWRATACAYVQAKAFRLMGSCSKGAARSTRV